MRFAKRVGAIICTIILAVTFCFGTTTAAAATRSEKSHVTLSWSGQNDTFNIRFNG